MLDGDVTDMLNEQGRFWSKSYQAVTRLVDGLGKYEMTGTDKQEYTGPH